MAQNVQAMVVFARARQNSYYRAALEASPQYASAAALRAKIVEAQQNLPGVPAAEPLEDVGADIGVWLDAVAAAEAAERVREVKSNALRDRLNWCDKAVEDVATAATGQILTSLHNDLTEVMDQVAAVVDRLDGARNPQEVIDRGVSDVWKQLSPLRSEYDRIRQAQEWAMAGEDLLTWSRSHYLYDDPLATDLAVANLDSVFPSWRDKDNRTVNLSDAPQQDPRPWPSDRIEQLVWLCASEAQPWVPTIAELHELGRQRSAQLNPPPEKRTEKPRPKQTSGRVVTGAAF